MGNTLTPLGRPGAPPGEPVPPACWCDQLSGVSYKQEAYHYFSPWHLPVTCRETDPGAVRQGLPDDGDPKITVAGRQIGPAACQVVPPDPMTGSFGDPGYYVFYRYPDPACPQQPGGCRGNGANEQTETATRVGSPRVGSPVAARPSFLLVLLALLLLVALAAAGVVAAFNARGSPRGRGPPETGGAGQ